jgi:hypothetical protein
VAEAKRKRAKRKLRLVVQTPDGSGFRMEVTADEHTVAPEVLDKWVPVCKRICEIIAEQMGAPLPASDPSTPEGARND